MSVKRHHSFLLTFLTISLFLSACGYRLGQGEGLASRFTSIDVPYVTGDSDGSLTAAIIREVVRSGCFEYRSCEGSGLTLHVKQIDLDEDNIGFRYDRKKRGKLTKDIIPIETRATIFVEVFITDATSSQVLLGPVRLSASVDYDHDYYLSRDGVNIFSLGQLSDLDAAYDAVQDPLNRLIAKKIVDYMTQSW